MNNVYQQLEKQRILGDVLIQKTLHIIELYGKLN